MVCNPVCKKLVSVKKESSLCDTVCLIVEFLRHHLVEIFQLLIFQNFCMKSCNTIYREACNDCKMSHFNLTIVNDSHFSDLLVISRIFCLHFNDEATIDFLDNLIYTGKKSGKQLDRPFLKSLGHNCVVCIGNTFCCDFPCFIPAKTFFVHEDSH